MTDREALRFAYTKVYALSGRIADGMVQGTYNNVAAALLDILPLAKDALDFLYDYLGEEEIEAAITEEEALE